MIKNMSIWVKFEDLSRIMVDDPEPDDEELENGESDTTQPMGKSRG